MPITNDPWEDERLRRLYDHHAAHQQYEQCTAERPFGPCTKRCEQPAGHDGQHQSQCITWCCDQHVPDACAPDEGAHQADDYPRPCCEQCPNGKAA